MSPQQQIVALLVIQRKKSGITQAELARRLGVSQTWVTHLECGERDLKVDDFVLLVRELKIPRSKITSMIHRIIAQR